jgi:hypothetical protein
MFCDEFRLMVRRFRGERRNLKFAVRSHGDVTSGVMLWGSMGIGYRSRLVFIRARLNGDQYIEEILRPIVLPLINEHAGVVLEQDNVRSHVAQISRTFLQHAEVENLPRARVPDLNPI